MTTRITTLFNNIWHKYLEVTPSAHQVHDLLGSGKDLINDHVAYRTFNLDKVNLDKLSSHLTQLGYKECGEYHFKAKKLYAKHFEHQDSNLPKVFISELLVEQLSEQAQIIINKLIASMPDDAVNSEDFLYSGTHWQLSHSEYETLLSESEYAAWLSAWGYQANHFTVSINHLEKFNDIVSVNDTLKAHGFTLNAAGGEIKGDEKVMLQQSSTLADKANVTFTDKTLAIPSCFYEFAKRFPSKEGVLYSGFVAASADKIFESTNVS